MAEIVALDGYTLNPGDLSWKSIEDMGNFKVYDRTSTAQVLERAHNAEIVIINKCAMDAGIIEQLPKLKHIAVSATGYNVVDIDIAKEKGISVSNIPGYGTSAVAQHVFAMILEVSNQVAANAISVADGKWARHNDWCYWEYPITELENKTLGIVGLGAIGGKVAKIAQAFGMKLLINDRSPEKKQAPGFIFTDVETVFSEADYITLHCPLTNANLEFVNKALIDKMKKTSVLINTGRGALINEVDLAEALKEDKIKAACLDVLTKEPPSIDNPLTSLENCYITPHNAWAAKDARERLMGILSENIKCFIEGKPKNIVNG